MTTQTKTQTQVDPILDVPTFYVRANVWTLDVIHKDIVPARYVVEKDLANWVNNKQTLTQEMLDRIIKEIDNEGSWQDEATGLCYNLNVLPTTYNAFEDALFKTEKQAKDVMDSVVWALDELEYKLEDEVKKGRELQYSIAEYMGFTSREYLKVSKHELLV